MFSNYQNKDANSLSLSNANYFSEQKRSKLNLLKADCVEFIKNGKISKNLNDEILNYKNSLPNVSQYEVIEIILDYIEVEISNLESLEKINDQTNILTKIKRLFKK